MLMLHAININDMGTKAKGDLSTGETMEYAFDIGKQWISRDHFIESGGIQMWDPGLDVLINHVG